MKKQILWLLFATLLLPLVYSCSNDDEPDYPSIIGTWYYSTESSSEYITLSMEVYYTFSANGDCKQEIIIKTNNVIGNHTVTECTYKYNGSTITFTSKKDGSVSVEQVSVTGNTMKLGDPNGDCLILHRK